MNQPVKYITFAFVFIFSFGCKEISFREPQPKGKKALKAIPAELRGTYLLTAEGDNSQDTLFVSKDGYLIAGDKKKNFLGDSLVLKKYKGYYFINTNENPEWLMRVIRREKNGDLTYLSMDVQESSFNSLIRSLAKEVPLDSSEVNGEKLYQIDPTPKQLIRLIQDGYFKNTIPMKRIK